MNNYYKNKLIKIKMLSSIYMFFTRRNQVMPIEENSNKSYCKSAIKNISKNRVLVVPICQTKKQNKTVINPPRTYYILLI